MTHRISLFFVIFISLSFLPQTQAQLKKLELIVDQKEPPQKCLYSNILFIDDRPASEKKKLNIDEKEFNNQLNTLLSGDLNETKTLLVQLRKLYYTYGDKENNGKYYMQLSTYEKDQDSSFYWIDTVSRLINQKVKDKHDQLALSNLVPVFVSNSLDTVPELRDDRLTDLDDVVVLEKERIKLYQTDQYTDGVYTSFSSFADQMPDYPISSYKFKDDRLKEVKYINPQSNKEQKINKPKGYAVVVKGEPFLLESNDYVPLYKDSINNICVTIEKSATASVGVYFGLIGAVLMPYNTKTETSEVMIDHLNGELSLKSKKIKNSTHHIFSKKPLYNKEKEVVGDGSNKKQW